MRKPDRSYRSDDYYIGDTTRQVMYKKTFLVSDTEKLQMETSTNDSLMVVCNDVFFVCDRCGYAKSSSSEKEEKKADWETLKEEYRVDIVCAVFFCLKITTDIM